MAIGDVVSDVQSIAAGAFLDVRPGAGVEWVIHNIYHEDTVQIQYYDGTIGPSFAVSLAGPNVEGNLQFHCTNTRRIRIANTHASLAKLIAYDGVQTK